MDGIKRNYLTELDKISHRPYTLGFTFAKEPTQYYPASREEQTYEFIGLVTGDNTMILKNKINPGEILEILSPHQAADGKTFVWQGAMQNQPESIVEIVGCPYPLHFNDILRRPKPQQPSSDQI